MTPSGTMVSPRFLGFALGGLLILLGALRRAPKDRVLVCQFIAWGAFIAALVVQAVPTCPEWVQFAFLATTALFAILSGYFGFLSFLRGWLQHRKEARQR
jgi:hypothetical protein